MVFIRSIFVSSPFSLHIKNLDPCQCFVHKYVSYIYYV